MDYSSSPSQQPQLYPCLPTIVTQKVEDEDDKCHCDDEEKQLHAVKATAYRPEVERLPSFTEVCNTWFTNCNLKSNHDSQKVCQIK